MTNWKRASILGFTIGAATGVASTVFLHGMHENRMGVRVLWTVGISLVIALVTWGVAALFFGKKGVDKV